MRRKQWVYAVFFLGIVLCMGGCRKKSNPADNIVAKEAEEEILQLHLGEISQEVSPFFYVTQGDEKLLSFLFLKAAEGEKMMANEQAAGGIRVLRSEKSTVYEISIKEGWKDSKGNELTADDLLFNYRLRCETGYRGMEQINQINIKGLKEYQFNAMGEECKKREKQVKKALAVPDKKLKRKIQEELICPVLKKEYAWVKSLYGQKEYESITKKYPKPQQLFAKFYAADVTYNGKKKTEKAVINDIAGQYEGDYQALSKITERDYEVLARCIAIETLFPDREGAEEEKREIDGIRRKDEYTIEIETTGFSKDDKKILADIFLMPKSAEEEIKSAEYFSVATGAYTAYPKSEHWILQANPYFKHQKPFVSSLQIKE